LEVGGVGWGGVDLILDLDLEEMVCIDHGGTERDASEPQQQEADGGTWKVNLGVREWLDNN
jgi:hypothetical protein